MASAPLPQPRSRACTSLLVERFAGKEVGLLGNNSGLITRFHNPAPDAVTLIPFRLPRCPTTDWWLVRGHAPGAPPPLSLTPALDACHCPGDRSMIGSQSRPVSSHAKVGSGQACIPGVQESGASRREGEGGHSAWVVQPEADHLLRGGGGRGTHAGGRGQGGSRGAAEGQELTCSPPPPGRS